MLFVVAINAKQFKVAEVKSNARIVYVLRRDVAFVMYYIARRSAPFAKPAFVFEVCGPCSLPSVGGIERLCILFRHRSHPLRQLFVACYPTKKEPWFIATALYIFIHRIEYSI